MMTRIYQIGRLDKDTKKYKFKVESNSYEQELTSLALKEHLKNSNPSVCLFYPYSLIFNSSVIDELIKNDNLKFDNIYDFFKNEHPLAKKTDDTYLLPSIGSYTYSGKQFVFNSKLSDITLLIFFKMIRDIYDYLERNNENEYKVYLDISSGHNIYISAMLEAARHFFVFYKLFTLDDDKLKIYLVYSDPILGNIQNLTFNIYPDYELKYKVFFNSSPVKKGDNIGDIFGKEINKKQNLNEIFNNFLIMFGAFIRKAPLVLYYLKSYDTQDLKKFILDIIQFYEGKYQENLFFTNPKSDKVIKAILMLAYYHGVWKFLSIKNDKSDKKDIEVELEEIEEKFINEPTSIYHKTNIDDTMLRKEVESIKNNENIKENYELLYKLQGYKDINEKQDIDIRNFEAHAGFLNTITLVRKDENGKIFLKYDTEKISNQNQNMFDNLLKKLKKSKH